MDMNFKSAYDFTSKWEGSYVNDPADPGGETKYGISKRSYPDIDIKSLTQVEAEHIYYNDYWLKPGCDQLERRLAICVFDAMFNCGEKRARRWLTEALTGLADDKLVKYAAPLFNQRRIAYYKDLVIKKPTLQKFFKGWLNRVNDLSKYIDIV